MPQSILLALPCWKVFQQAVKARQKRLLSADFTVTGKPIVNNYESASEKASLVLSAPDCKDYKIDCVLGPCGLKFLHQCLDSSKKSDYPIYELLYHLDKISAGADQLVRIGVVSVLCGSHYGVRTQHSRAAAASAIHYFRHDPDIFIRPTSVDLTPGNAELLYLGISELKGKFEKLVRSAEKKDTCGKTKFTLTIAHGTL